MNLLLHINDYEARIKNDNNTMAEYQKQAAGMQGRSYNVACGPDFFRLHFYLGILSPFPGQF